MESLMKNNFMEQVTTYDGTTAPRRECRFIKGAFYIKNKQCFCIDGKWYRVNSSFVVFDHEKKVWVLKDSIILINGIIAVKADSSVEFGYFSANPNTNIRFLYKGKICTVINLTILRSYPGLKEGLNGCYYSTLDSNIPREFNMKMKPHKDGFYSFPFNYGSEELIPEFTKTFTRDFKGEPLLSDAYKYIENYTFGMEFETEKGAIKETFLKKNGIIACRDGSISGFEYTTIPLQGETGIQAIKVTCDLLKKYCSCSPNESLHIHIGNYPRTVKAIASLYRLGLIIQTEVYSLFPYFYTNTAEFKKKSYCGPLPTLGTTSVGANKIFADLYFWLSNGGGFTRFPTGPHPMDRSGQQKWNVSPRYVWLNLIPLIWNGKGTVEFRCHVPTVLSQKAINWLYITTAILSYARKHATYLTSASATNLSFITLSEIMKEAYPSDIADILNNYITERKKYYSNKKDIIGEYEIMSEELDKGTFTLIPFV